MRESRFGNFAFIEKNNNFKRLLTWVLFSLQTFICLMYDLNKTTNALLALPYVKQNSIVYRLFCISIKRHLRR